MTIDFPRETEIETKNEMDAVLQAGRVLMESGAEIYRIQVSRHQRLLHLRGQSRGYDLRTQPLRS